VPHGFAIDSGVSHATIVLPDVGVAAALDRVGGDSGTVVVVVADGTPFGILARRRAARAAAETITDQRLTSAEV